MVRTLQEKSDKQKQEQQNQAEDPNNPEKGNEDFDQSNPTLAVVKDFKLIKVQGGDVAEIVSKDLYVKFTPNNIHVANGDDPFDIGYSTMELSCTVDNFPSICHVSDYGKLNPDFKELVASLDLKPSTYVIEAL